MVSFNVAQLLKLPVGEVRRFQFAEQIDDPDHELHLSGPVRGRVKLLRTTRGILVQSNHEAAATLECARCLDPVEVGLDGKLEEEFLPALDVRTGVPLVREELTDPDQPRIDENHHLQLDDMLRQSLLTSMPLQPLCEIACPGLCTRCGTRLDARHTVHHPDDDGEEDAVGPPSLSPFARLAELMRDRTTNGSSSRSGAPLA